MDTKKLFVILGLILIIFFIMHNVRLYTRTTVVYRKPVNPIHNYN